MCELKFGQMPGSKKSGVIDVSNFPDIRAENIQETNRRLLAMSKSLREALLQHQDFDPEEEDDVDEAYHDYIAVLERSLPAGYKLKQVRVPISNLWRGAEPTKIISLLTGQGNSMRIQTHHPNVATTWETSLSYGASRNRDVPFIMAIGFAQPADWSINKTEIMRDGRKVYNAHGTINFFDIKEVALRINSSRGVVTPRFYRLVPEQTN